MMKVLLWLKTMLSKLSTGFRNLTMGFIMRWIKAYRKPMEIIACFWIAEIIYRKRHSEKSFALNRSEDILYGNMMIDFGSGNLVKGIMPEKIDFKQLMRDTLWHPVSFIRKNCYCLWVCMTRVLKITADYDFFIRAILINKCSLHHLQETISVFPHDGISSLPANRKKTAEEKGYSVTLFQPETNSCRCLWDRFWKSNREAQKYHAFIYLLNISCC